MHIPSEKKKIMLDKLTFVYGVEKSEAILREIEQIVSNLSPRKPGKSFFDQTDAVLITYGDQLKETGKSPLRNLNEFMNEHLKDIVSAVHILPFYPYTSDDGFSVTNYFQIGPNLGSWSDVEALAAHFDLMFDAVVNHISSQSEWFQGYLKGDPRYRNYFIEADPEADYSAVTRPRTLPLLTKFETAFGPKHIWTTFSDDQIDLNFANERVLLDIMKLLLFYTEKGARMIRLDAVGYIWKSIGSSCIHLEETHRIVQLFRDVLDIAAPGTKIITETNVPHRDNISYFGEGHNEAHMVYQFPLPPLTLHSIITGNAKALSEWASTLEPVSDETTFFNFLASHDGIGVVPVQGILTEAEMQYMVEQVQRRGGFVSFKNKGDGNHSPYELNINYFDALSDPSDDEEIKVKRFLAAQAVLLSLAGVPGIYVHSLLGSRNDKKGVEVTGRYRSINREKLQRKEVEAALNNPSSLRFKVFYPYKKLLEIRCSEQAFHPNAPQYVLFVRDSVFSLVRTSKDGKEQVYCLINVSPELQDVSYSIQTDGSALKESSIDLVSGRIFNIVDGQLNVCLEPYQVMWIKVGFS
jgi:glycosidase